MRPHWSPTAHVSPPSKAHGAGMRTFLALCVIATVAVLGVSPDAKAAGTPPTVEFTFSCGPDMAVIEWTVTNVDMLAHALEVVVQPGGDATPQPLTTGQPSVEGSYGIADPFVAAGIDIVEEGVVIATTGLLVSDPGADDCWSVPLDMAPVDAVAPTVTFETHCDDGGTVVEIHVVNNDLGIHDLDATLEKPGFPGEEILVPQLTGAEPEIQVDTFVPWGTTFQVVVKEGDDILGVSPIWQALADDGFCAVEPDPDLPVVPLDDIPLDQPTTTTAVPVPEPDPTTTTTTSTTLPVEPTTTTTVVPEQPVVEAFAASEVVRSFTPAPAGSADVPAAEPAQPAEALPRTGAPVSTLVPMGWLLIGVGTLVRRAAARRS